MAEAEVNNMHLKAELIAMQRHPLLRHLFLSTLVKLACYIRRCRSSWKSYLEKSEEWRNQRKDEEQETSALRFWDLEAARK
ncbi:unnamed protein product, partial [Amoebophrya sp. A25]|eukprot:GSA25T00008886001.1